MSRQMDFSQPLAPEDVAYAEQFPGLHGQMLQANAEQHGVQADTTLDGRDDEDVPYGEWNVADLKAEAVRRNKEEGTNLPTSGKKEDLVAALEKDDGDRPQ
jgi:hypothetical protein